MVQAEISITLINKNFLIRITHDSTTFLKGAGQYHKIVGQELANKHFKKALNSKTDNTTIKLRRGLRIDFVSK